MQDATPPGVGPGVVLLVFFLVLVGRSGVFIAVGIPPGMASQYPLWEGAGPGMGVITGSSWAGVKLLAGVVGCGGLSELRLVLSHPFRFLSHPFRVLLYSGWYGGIILLSIGVAAGVTGQ